MIPFSQDQIQAIEAHARNSGLSPTDYLWGLHLRAASHQITGHKGIALLRAAKQTFQALRPLIEEMQQLDPDGELVRAAQALATALQPYRRGQ